MSIAAHHADWLNLVESSGPFLSGTVLVEAFPTGLPKLDPSRVKELKMQYEQWQENPSALGAHRQWIEFVLKQFLEYPKDFLTEGQSLPAGLEFKNPEFGETLRPDFAIVKPSNNGKGQTKLLISVYPSDQKLDRAISDKRWKTSPDTRMVELLRACEVPVGLVTNGEHWMLVYADPGQPSGFASWLAQIWVEERPTLRAFYSLLSVGHTIGAMTGFALEDLLRRSSENQEEVTDQLGYQVRRAVEMLVQAFDKADRDTGGRLLKEIPESVIYESALTVMMRLVFLFSAEEQGLLLLGDRLYDDNYAVSTLREQLREAADRHGEEVLERYQDAWHRLLATFRAVHGGIDHEDLSLPAYGGTLFDPDRYAFLEGRPAGSQWRIAPASPLPIDNRTVLHLLEALQLLEMQVPGGRKEARKLSFRALDIEQIGHVYEGLLDHTAVRADDLVVSLKSSGKMTKTGDEPEYSLSQLETQLKKSRGALLEFLIKPTGRSISALEKDLDAELDDHRLHRLKTACDNNEQWLQRVLPLAGLVRNDDRDYPAVYPPGSVYVTQGMERRQTGTHYTPRSLTEPIVQHTLEPLLYPDMPEGKPKEKSRKLSVSEVLDLKICDMAMGSGAFLVQTCRFLANYILQSWADTEAEASKVSEKPVLTVPYADPATGVVSEQALPKDEKERLAIARRLVAEKCLYGVDKNPMAVEMAKLSLWLTTLAKGRPFTFLDHALKSGDSLIGLNDVGQISFAHIHPKSCEEDSQSHLWFSIDTVHQALLRAIEKRLAIEKFIVREPADFERKERLLKEAEDETRKIHLVCDLVSGYAIQTADGNSKRRDGAPPENFEEERSALLQKIQPVFEDLEGKTGQETHYGAPASCGQEESSVQAGSPRSIDRGAPASCGQEAFNALSEEARQLLRTYSQIRTPFHWPLEFPEILAHREGEPGFDAIIGNPPFMGGQKITGNIGTDYRNFLVDYLAEGQKGSADLCAYFFLQAGQLLRKNGQMAMLATNTIAQGDTREVGLDQLAHHGFTIPRAIASRKWPGKASLEIAEVWMRKGSWKAKHYLEDREVKGITPYLVVPGKTVGKPYRLKANEGKSFIGSYVLGMGFVLEPEQAKDLIKKDPKNKGVLFPYLNGQDLNSHPEQKPSRWVINFFDWPLNREAKGSWSEADEKQRKGYLQKGMVPSDYPDPVAADYPECLEIVERLVKPERMKINDKVGRIIWWRFLRTRPELHSTIAGMERVLVKALVTGTWAIIYVPSDIVFMHKLCVFPLHKGKDFSLIQSTIKEVWSWKTSSSLGGLGNMNYSPSDSFETFPFPNSFEILGNIGESYYNHRQSVMKARQEGLTKTYNRFHDKNEKSEDIRRLRELHVEMDRAVAEAYGWTDLDLGHGFHETKQGERYTICEDARREILDRLLDLNHQRYAEEVAQGLHEKRGGKVGGKRGKKKKASSEPSLLDGL